MFLFWNYTIEAFFWILFVAISIISLTIFLARPKEKSKPLTALETYDGEITETEPVSYTHLTLPTTVIV